MATRSGTAELALAGEADRVFEVAQVHRQFPDSELGLTLVNASGSSRRCACPTSNLLRQECLPSEMVGMAAQAVGDGLCHHLSRHARD
jgi:hypothetical protein